MKEIIDKLASIKIKNFCTAKDIVKNMKRQVTDWEEISAKRQTNNELLYKVYNKTLKTQQKEHKKPD